jgi:SET domain-containing protein
VDQSIAGDIVEFAAIGGQMSSRSFRLGRSRTGLGLFAIKPIKRGAYIATYRGRRIATEEADQRAARGASYMFEVNKRWTIDGSPRWNVARYINHSCRPNAKVGRKGGIVIVALRQIEPGEEITYDYGREYLRWFSRQWWLSLRGMPKKASLSAPENARIRQTNEIGSASRSRSRIGLRCASIRHLTQKLLACSPQYARANSLRISHGSLLVLKKFV